MSRDTFDRFQQPDRGLFGDNESSPGGHRVNGKSDLLDLTMALHHETGKAVLVSETGDKAKAKWIAKSLCEVVHLHEDIRGKTKRGQTVTLPAITLTLPQWIAKREGLI